MADKVQNMNELQKINSSANMKTSAKIPPKLIHLTVMGKVEKSAFTLNLKKLN